MADWTPPTQGLRGGGTLRVPLHSDAGPAGGLDRRAGAPARDLLKRGRRGSRPVAARHAGRAPGPRSNVPGTRPVALPFSNVT